VGKRWDNSGFRLLWRNCSNLAFDALHIAGVIAKEPPKFPGPNYRAKWLASAFREKDKDKVFWMIKEDGKLVGTKGPKIELAKLAKFVNFFKDDFKALQKVIGKANADIKKLFKDMKKSG